MFTEIILLNKGKKEINKTIQITNNYSKFQIVPSVS